MKKLKIFFALAALTTFISCSKNAPIPGQSGWECGTVADMTWTQNVSADSLAGNWTIWWINYSRGAGQTHYYDTSYALTAPLTLNANGTGTIYSIPLNWSLTVSQNNLPKLTITKLDTLFPFQVNFIYNDTADTYLESPPHIQSQSRFFVTAGKDYNGRWERTYINFERQ